MSSGWRKISIAIFVAILALCAVLTVVGSVSSHYTADSIVKEYDIPIGQSMFENQSIVGTTDPIEVPIVSNIGFLTHQIQVFDLQGLLAAFTTGVVPFDFSTIAGEGIAMYGLTVLHTNGWKKPNLVLTFMKMVKKSSPFLPIKFAN